MMSCLRLYAAPLVLLIEALLVSVASTQVWAVAARLVALACALALSIREQRRLAHARRRKP